MPSTIEIDDEVYARLADEAVPFVETTPNAVLRRLLGLAEAHTTNGHGRTVAVASSSPAGARTRPASGGGARTRSAKAPGRRAKRGSLLAKSAYETPILEALVAAGGRAASREVVEAVGRTLDRRLGDADREVLRSGEVRWQNRVHFTRLDLVETGLLKSDSPRGVWEITDAGRQLVQDNC